MNLADSSFTDTVKRSEIFHYALLFILLNPHKFVTEPVNLVIIFSSRYSSEIIFSEISYTNATQRTRKPRYNSIVWGEKSAVLQRRAQFETADFLVEETTRKQPQNCTYSA